MMDSLQALYAQIQSLKGEQLTRAMCEAVQLAWTADGMQELEKHVENPVALVLGNEWYRPSGDVVSRDLVEIFLKQLERRREDARLRETEARDETFRRSWNIDRRGFVRLDHYIVEAASPPGTEELPSWLFHEPDIAQILWYYFSANRYCLDDVIDAVCLFVYHGVPLYQERDGHHEHVSYEDHDYIYLSKKGEYRETGSAALDPPGQMPEWTDRYFFKWEDIAAHRQFFGWGRSSPPPLAVPALRDALREYIAQMQGSAPIRPASVLPDPSRSQTRIAAQKRWAPLKSVRARAIELYLEGSGKWQSRADAGRKLKPKIMEWARDAGSPLSDENALGTIDGWLKDAEKSA